MNIIKKVFNLENIQPPKSSMRTPSEFLASYCNQRFSLPSSILYYIARNPPSPESYLKWIKICKYFFIKNPIVVINSICLGSDESSQNLCSKKSSMKLWITGGFVVLPSEKPYQSLFPTIMPKIYKCDAARLSLYDISLTLNEFMFLSLSTAKCILKNVSIKYRNGKDVELEKLVAVCTNVKIFEYAFTPNPSNFSSKTIANIIKIPHFLALKRFSLMNIPDTLDTKPLFEFLKTNDLYVTLEFCNTLSEKYRSQLEDIIFEILETDAYIYGPPSLTIPSMDFDRRIALLQKARFAKF